MKNETDILIKNKFPLTSMLLGMAASSLPRPHRTKLNEEIFGEDKPEIQSEESKQFYLQKAQEKRERKKRKNK